MSIKKVASRMIDDAIKKYMEEQSQDNLDFLDVMVGIELASSSKEESQWLDPIVEMVAHDKERIKNQRE